MSTSWEKAIERLLADTKLASSSLGPVIRNFGDEPTALIVGPTGSGKSSFLNLWLGARLLPEGLGHTTPVPTIVFRDNTPRLVALSANARPIERIPVVDLPLEILESHIPDSKEALLARLLRAPDPEFHRRLYETFWKPSFDAAKANECVAIALSAPLAWLPEGVRLVDLPGYEGWFPQETPELHQLVTRWLDTADMALFVASVSRLKVGYGTEFMNYHKKKGGSLALWVNQIDNLALDEKWQSALREYRNEVADLLQSQGFKNTDDLDIYFGCTRLDRASKLGDAFDHILETMIAAGQVFSYVLHQLPELWASRRLEQHRRRKEKSADETEQLIAQHRMQLQQVCDDGLEKARGRYVSQRTRRKLIDSVHRAIDRTGDPMQLRQAIEEKLRQRILQCQEKVVDEYWSDLEQAIIKELRDRFGSQVSTTAFHHSFNEKYPNLENLFGIEKGELDEAVQIVADAGNPIGFIDWIYSLFSSDESIRRIKDEAKNQVNHLITFDMLAHTFKPLENTLKKNFTRVWNGSDGMEASIRSIVKQRISEQEGRNLAASASHGGIWVLHQVSPGSSKLIRTVSNRAKDEATVLKLALPEMGSPPVAAILSDEQQSPWFVYTDPGGRIILVDVAPDGVASWQNLTLRSGWSPRAVGRPWAIQQESRRRVFFICNGGHLNEISTDRDGCSHRTIRRLPQDVQGDGGLMGIRDTAGILLTYRDSLGHVQFLNEADQWNDWHLSRAADYPPLAYGNPFLYRYIDGLHVMYRGKNGHIHELMQRGTKWYHHPLTIIYKFPKASGNPIAYVDGSQMLYYRGIDSHLHELVWTGETWQHYQLTGFQGKPASFSDPSFIINPSKSVTYIDELQMINRLECQDNHWNHTKVDR